MQVGELKQICRGRWQEVIERTCGLRLESMKHQPCPKCGGRDRFRPFGDFAESGGVYCNQCHSKGCQDGVGTVQWLLGVDFKEAIRVIAEVAAAAPDPIAALAKSKRVTPGAMKRYSAYNAHNGYVAIPMLDQSGDCCGVLAHQSPEDKGRINAGGKAGLFLPRINGGPRLPAKGETWIICEGWKDACALAEFQSIPVAGINGNRLPANLVEAFRGVNVIVWPDIDDAGLRGAEASAQMLQGVASKATVAKPRKILSYVDARDYLQTEEGRRAVKDAIVEALGRDPTSPEHRGSLRITRFSERIQKPLTWLWEGYVPNGSLTFLDGEPESGKSLISLDIAARFCAPRGGISPVLRLASHGQSAVAAIEDDYDSVIGPRLAVAGATLSTIFSLEGLSIPSKLDELGQAITQNKIALLIIDPFDAFIDGGIGLTQSDEVRRSFGGLASLAREADMAILLIRHATKGAQSAKNRGLGSIAFTGLARSVLSVAKRDDQTYVMGRVKGNLSQRPLDLVYEIVGDEQPKVKWLGTSAKPVEEYL